MPQKNSHTRTNLLGIFCAICIVVLIGVIYSKAQAATIVWDGGGTTNNWSDAGNWSLNTVPGPNDYAFFDGTSNKNAVMDIAVTVGGIQLGSAYTGTVSQGSNLPLTVTLYGLFVKSGAFHGSNADINVTGDVLITGGSFVSTSGTLQLTKNWTAQEGIFDANGGTVVFGDHLPSNIHMISGSTTFHHLALRTTNPEMQLILPGGESNTQIITGDLTLHAHSGATMLLVSDKVGVAARISVQGVVDMRGVRIRDIQNIGENDIDCGTTCFNMGGNSGWIFTIPVLYSLDALAIDGVHMQTGNIDQRVDAVWEDSTRTQTNATLYNISLPATTRSGWRGTGIPGDPYRLEFDGVDDYVHIGNVGIAGALSVWFRSDSTDDKERVLIPQHGNDGYGVRLHDGVLTTGFGQFGLVQSTAVVPGTWYHLVVTREGSGVRYYLNGTQFAATIDNQNGFWSGGDSGYWQLGNFDYSLGTKPSWTLTPFMGAVGSLRIYGKEANLSPAQVTRLYEKERGRFMTAADGSHISRIMPANEDMSGNTGIIIHGERLDTTTSVTINGQEARSFVIESPTKMTVMPAVLAESGSPGYVLSITVTTPDGTVSAKGSFLSSVATRTNKYVTWFDAANLNGTGATSATTPSSTTWTSLDSGREAKLRNFSVPATTRSGWQGTGVPGDPYRLEFDGVDDFVRIGHVGLAGALSVWFRSDSTDDKVRTLIPQSGNDGYGVRLHDGVLTASLGVQGLVQSTAVVPGTWYHLVVTRDGAGVRYYLNGTQFAATLDTQNGFWSAGDSGYWQGNHLDYSLSTKPSWTLTPFMGAVASLRIYGKDANLSPAQVTRLYEEERGRFMTSANEPRMTRTAPIPNANSGIKVWLDARNFSGVGSSNIEQLGSETWASLESGREAKLLKFSVPPTVSQGTGQTCDPPHVTFDGIDDVIHVGHVGKIRTYAMWFRADAEINMYQYVMSQNGNSHRSPISRTGNMVYIQKGMLGAAIGLYGIAPTTPIKTGQWYQLVVSRDDSAARFYLNGHEFTTLVDNGNGFWTAGDAGWWAGNEDYYLGAKKGPDSQHFKGGIASFRLSANSMTANEILSMYYEEKDKFGLPDTSGSNPSHGLLPTCTVSISSSSSSSSTSSLSSSISSSLVSSSTTSATSSSSSESSSSVSSLLPSSSSSSASSQSSTSISSSASSSSSSPSASSLSSASSSSLVSSSTSSTLSSSTSSVNSVSSSSSSSTSSLSSSVSSSEVPSSSSSTLSSSSSESVSSTSSSLQSSSSSTSSVNSVSSSSATDNSSSLSSSSSSSRPQLTPIALCSRLQEKDIKTLGGVIAPIVGGALLHAGLQIAFQDVPANMWFAIPIYCDVSAGISSGYDDAEGRSLDVYHPDWPITYAETARVTLEIAAKDVERVVGPRWFLSYFSAAKREKLSVYLGNRSIDPYATPTRGEFIQTLLEAIGMEFNAGRPTYDDVPANHPYAAAIAKATQLGIISGDDGTNRFRPDEPMNRAESAKIRMTTMELPQLQELYLRRAFIKR